MEYRVEGIKTPEGVESLCQVDCFSQFHSQILKLRVPYFFISHNQLFQDVDFELV